MKNKIVLLSVVVILGLLLVSLTGCTTEYTREDVEKFVKEMGVKNFFVSLKCEEINDDEGYTDKLWTVEDKDRNITFHVLDDHYYGSEFPTNHLITDCGDIILKKYYDSLSPKPLINIENYRYSSGEIDEIEIIGKYTNKSELERCYEEFALLESHLKKEGIRTDRELTDDDIEWAMMELEAQANDYYDYVDLDFY